MSIEARQSTIVSLLAQIGSADVEELSQRFEVSQQTIRNDLRDLSAKGLVKRTHGGARLRQSVSNPAYADRRQLNADAKKSIAQAAASLIPSGSAVALNIGTTTEAVADALSKHQDLFVLSNNVNIINRLIESQCRELVLVGGSVRPSDGAIVGEDAVAFIERYKVDVAVIGASSLDADGAILDYDAREVAVARAILRNARQKILVSDGSKFEASAPIRICDVADLDHVVTDRPPPQSFQDAANIGQTNVIVVDQNQ